jgi:hypothetical protein
MRPRILRGTTIVVGTAVALLTSGPSMAYVGPGAGITLIGSLWAVLVAVVLALAGLLWWPLRALLQRRKAVAGGGSTETEGDRERSDA